MRTYARVRAGRIVALGVRVWLRRLLQLNVVAAICLAPLLLRDPELRGDPLDDGRFLGLFGLFTSAWATVLNMTEGNAGILRQVATAYAAQFAVTVLLVRDARRTLGGRAPKSAPLGLVLLAAGGFVLFVLLDSPAAAASENRSGLPLALALAATAGEIYLSGAGWLAVAAAAVDGHGAVPALARSALLSAGSRANIAAVVVVLVLLQWALIIPAAVLLDALRWGPRAAWTLGVLVAILFLSLKACVLAAAYHEACDRKEGSDEEVSAVFA